MAESTYEQNNFFIDVTRGLHTDKERIYKFGRNSDIDTGTAPEDIWEGGGTYTGQPIGDVETLEIFSSSANDTSAGTGARTVTIYGLDSDFVEQEETLTLNGTTAVTSSNTYSRCTRVRVRSAGSTGTNQGTLTVRHTTTTANVFAVVPIDANQSQIAAWTVPANKTFYITNLLIQMARTNGSPGSATVVLCYRPDGEVYQKRRIIDITDSMNYVYSGDGGLIPCPAKTDILIRCDDVSDNNTVVTAEFKGILINDN